MRMPTGPRLTHQSYRRAKCAVGSRSGVTWWCGTPRHSVRCHELCSHPLKSTPLLPGFAGLSGSQHLRERIFPASGSRGDGACPGASEAGGRTSPAGGQPSPAATPRSSTGTPRASAAAAAAAPRGPAPTAVTSGAATLHPQSERLSGGKSGPGLGSLQAHFAFSFGISLSRLSTVRGFRQSFRRIAHWPRTTSRCDEGSGNPKLSHPALRAAPAGVCHVERAEQRLLQ